MISIDPQKPKGIVWLASYPKSGNTWLRMFLYQLARIRRGLPQEDDEINKLSRVSQSDLHYNLLFDQFLGKSKRTEQDFVRVRPMVQAAIAAHSPGIAMLKTHTVLGLYLGYPTVNQQASVGGIYLVRDPRDVAVSLWHHTGRSLDFAVNLVNQRDAFAFGDGKFAGEMWGSWSQNVGSWINGADSSLLVLRYEDMLTKPTAVFGAVVKHLRQAVGEDQLAEAIRLSSFGEMKRQEDTFGFFGKAPKAERFFVGGKTGTWRGKLNLAQVKSIIDAHGDMMRKFDYLD